MHTKVNSKAGSKLSSHSHYSFFSFWILCKRMAWHDSNLINKNICFYLIASTTTHLALKYMKDKSPDTQNIRKDFSVIEFFRIHLRILLYGNFDSIFKSVTHGTVKANLLCTCTIIFRHSCVCKD